jgi:hypothetical protein
VPEFLLEFYVSRSDGAAVADGARRARAAAAQLNREGTPVRYLRSLFLPDEETCFYLYEAASADAVRAAACRAQLPSHTVAEAITEPKGETR